MTFLNIRLLSLLSCIICLIVGKNSFQTSELNILSGNAEDSIKDHRHGYYDIVRFQEKYIAVGTSGRIDCITLSGEKKFLDTTCRFDLNCAYANDRIFLAAGNKGNILSSLDGKIFSPESSGTKKDIHTITSRSGIFIAGADSGTILRSVDGIFWRNIQIKVRGNIVSLSANNSIFIGVSDAGEIIKSIDGMKWEIQDYNKEFSGYYPYSKFRKIVAGLNNIVIIGIHSDGSPSILYSVLGNVWTERPPIYQDEQGVFRDLNSTPNGIAYDTDRDQFIIACDNGELLTLPPCAQCNKWAKVSDNNFYANIYLENHLLIVGEEYFVLIQDVL
jgi:hypothetical protein